MSKISALNALGYVPDGDDVQIILSERQAQNLVTIVETYKEEMCASRQDISNCQSLLDVIQAAIANKKTK